MGKLLIIQFPHEYVKHIKSNEIKTRKIRYFLIFREVIVLYTERHRPIIATDKHEKIPKFSIIDLGGISVLSVSDES